MTLWRLGLLMDFYQNNCGGQREMNGPTWASGLTRVRSELLLGIYRWLTHQGPDETR